MVFTLLLCCVAYFFYIPQISFISILSNGVSVLMFGTLLLLLFLRLRGKRTFIFPLITLIIAFMSFGTIYQIGPTAQVVSKTTALSVMTYNVRSFNDRGLFEPKDAGDHIMGLIRENSPDILCFQEFTPKRTKEFRDYQHRYITPRNTSKTTQAIFSKYPIVNIGSIPFPNSSNNTIYADIVFAQDTIRVYNVHLQSYQIYGSLRNVARSLGMDLMKKMNSVMEKHREQALLVRDHQKTSPYPSLICGDLNSTAFSNTYRLMKKGMQDSFREKGSGWGTTFLLGRGVPFRIDYILASDGFEFLSHQNFKERLSDHLPVQATLQPKTK